RELELGERLRVRRRVPAAAVGENEGIRRRPELFDDLEDRRLLALDAVRVERVDEDVVAALAELLRGGERLVEAPAHGEHVRAERTSLDQLPAGGALCDEHDRAEPGPGCVRRGGRGRVA